MGNRAPVLISIRMPRSAEMIFFYGSALGIDEPGSRPAHHKEQQPTAPTEGRFRLPLSCLTATYR
jgi:hypothetical protein